VFVVRPDRVRHRIACELGDGVCVHFEAVFSATLFELATAIESVRVILAWSRMSAVSTSRQLYIEQPTSFPNLCVRINTILRTSIVRDGMREAKLHPGAVEFGIFPAATVFEICLPKGSSLVFAQVTFAEHFCKR
jgi:hypothetical protein